MKEETIPERQARLDENLENDRTTFYDFRKEMRERLNIQDQMLQVLTDDLKLRRWLAKFIKSLIIIVGTIIGIVHAPDWLRHLFGLHDLKK